MIASYLAFSYWLIAQLMFALSFQSAEKIEEPQTNSWKPIGCGVLPREPKQS